MNCFSHDGSSQVVVLVNQHSIIYTNTVDTSGLVPSGLYMALGFVSDRAGIRYMDNLILVDICS